MFSQRYLPKEILPEELDDYLQRGWYRYGQSLGTCRFLTKKGQLFSVVWIRQLIDGFQFRKGQRKLMRKVADKFKVVIQPERRNVPEKEALYQKYRADFKEQLASSLELSLYDNLPYNIFNSFEVAIYDEDELIAFSVFDVGKEAIQSIKGVYHPDYKEFSLGYYTMLIEIQYCIDNGLKYYYPGYVTPGLPAFNYKLRIGEVEYYDFFEKSWNDWSQFDETTLESRKMMQKLAELSDELTAQKIKHRLRLYPIYEVELWKLESHFHFGFPVFVEAFPNHFLGRSLNFVYNVEEGVFRFIPCYQMQDISQHFPSSTENNAIENADDLLGMITNWRAGSTTQEAIKRMKVWISQQMFS